MVLLGALKGFFAVVVGRLRESRRQRDEEASTALVLGTMGLVLFRASSLSFGRREARYWMIGNTVQIVVAPDPETRGLLRPTTRCGAEGKDTVAVDWTVQLHTTQSPARTLPK